MNNRNAEHWNATVRILQHVKSTRLDGLVLGTGGRGKGEREKLHVYAAQTMLRALTIDVWCLGPQTCLGVQPSLGYLNIPMPDISM